MTEQSELHLRHIKDEVCRMLDEKYRKGFEEHHAVEGELEEMPLRTLLQNVLAEVTDLNAYLITLRDKVKVLLEILDV